jgi:hypothetical protein
MVLDLPPCEMKVILRNGTGVKGELRSTLEIVQGKILKVLDRCPFNGLED